MSEPTVSGSPPPPPALVLPSPPLVLSLPPPQPIAATEASASRRTAKRAVNRVFLIRFPPIPFCRTCRTYKLRFYMPSAGAFESHSAGWQTPATLFEVKAGHARRVTQQTLRRALRRHRRVDRQHAAGRAAAALAKARGPHLRQARGAQPNRLGQGPGGEVND